MMPRGTVAPPTMPDSAHPAEARALAAGYGAKVHVTPAEAQQLIGSARYTSSMGLGVGQTHYRAGQFHLSGTVAPSKTGKVTHDDGDTSQELTAAAGTSTSTASSSSASSGGGGGGGGSYDLGDDGWTMHVDKHDPHAGPIELGKHVTEDVPGGAAAALLAGLAALGALLWWGSS